LKVNPFSAYLTQEQTNNIPFFNVPMCGSLTIVKPLKEDVIETGAHKERKFERAFIGTPCKMGSNKDANDCLGLG